MSRLVNDFKDEPFLIYIHIQKAAGMSVQRMLRRQYGPSLYRRAIRRLNLDPVVNRSKWDQFSQQRYFAGHFGFGIHELLPQPATYLSIFREPVARLISLYSFSRHNRSAYYHDWGRRMTLEEFLLGPDALEETDNGMVRYLLGEENTYWINRQQPMAPWMLDKAKENVEKYFAFVGVLEQFDFCALLLKERLGWENCLYLRRNESAGIPKPEVSDEMRERIAEKNVYDLDLYAWIKERFQKDLNEHLPDAETQLQAFVEKNKSYNAYMLKPYAVYDGMKKRLTQRKADAP